MKHIIAYPLWEREEPNAVHDGFIRELTTKLKELGIEWKNWATPRQSKGGTIVLHLSNAQGLKLFKESGWNQYLSGIKLRKAERLLKDPLMPIWEKLLSSEVEIRPRTHSWWISRGGIRAMLDNMHYGSPLSSHREVEFVDPKTTVESALGEFQNITRRTLNDTIQSYRQWLELDHPVYVNRITKLISRLNLPEIKTLMKFSKNPTAWFEIFGSADLPQSTFAEIAQDPELSEDLKRAVYSNPNWADTEKVEDILGDWG